MLTGIHRKQFKANKPKSAFDRYCADNPEAPESRIYDV
ncbi:MAG: CP12 domain-containing protein [Cyanobacteria bacterium P01_A01_bin.37]